MELHNYSRAIFLISEEVRCVICTYEKDEDAKHGKADRVKFKTFDQTIKKGDFVVVPTDTRWGMTVVKVHETEDVDPEISSHNDIKWIVGVVNRADYDDIKKQEERAVTAIKSAKRKAAQKKLKEELMADMGSEDTKLLTVTVPGQPTAEPPPQPARSEPEELPDDEENPF